MLEHQEEISNAWSFKTVNWVGAPLAEAGLHGPTRLLSHHESNTEPETRNRSQTRKTWAKVGRDEISCLAYSASCTKPSWGSTVSEIWCVFPKEWRWDGTQARTRRSAMPLAKYAAAPLHSKTRASQGRDPEKWWQFIETARSARYWKCLQEPNWVTDQGWH